MKIHIKTMQFSLVIVRPKPAFLRWIEPSSQLSDTKARPAYPEGNSVWLVPQSNGYSSSLAANKYIDELKPKIARREVEVFSPQTAALHGPWTPTQCDEFFECELRDRAIDAAAAQKEAVAHAEVARRLPSESLLPIDPFITESPDFSLLVIRPKLAFFTWLEALAAKRGLRPDRIYFPEENGVWLIPSSWEQAGALRLHDAISKLKPIIAARELGQFGPGHDMIPDCWTAAVCDEHFELEYRRRVFCA